MPAKLIAGFVALAATSVVSSVLTTPAAAAPVYTLLDLGTLGGTETRAFDVNELGQVVGSSVNAAGLTEAFRTAPNAPINPLTDGLGFLPGGTSSIANGVNDIGQVVGDALTANGQRGFFTGPNQSTLNDVGVFPNHTTSNAVAINNTGQIVGTSRYQTGAIAYRTTSARPIDPATDPLEPMGGPLPTQSQGADVNAGGQAAGNNGNNGFRTGPNSQMVVGGGGIGTFGGSTWVFAMNDAGQAVGFSTVPNSQIRAFRTGPNAGINPATDNLGTLGGTSSFASDVNDSGVVVGTSDIAANAGPGNAFVYVDGEGMIDLNTLVLNIPDGWHLFHAEGINDLGQIVGYATNQQNPTDRLTYAFLLTPVPEPSSAALLLGPGGVLLTRRRRAARA